MDTLETWSEVYLDKGFEVTSKPPILWRNKTPQQVAREHYPDQNFLKKKDGNLPKSMRPDAEFCDTYYCHPHDESQDRRKVYGTLIAIPDKK